MGNHQWWKVDVWVGLAARLWLGTWLQYAFLNTEKWKSRACFEHIWSVFIFNNSQWVFIYLPLPMEAEFLTHRLVFFNFYTQLLKSGMKNSGRISKHDISLVEKFLCIPMAMANGSSNSYETYFEIREVPIPSLTYNLGAMGKTTSKPPGRLAHQIFTMGGSPWLHTNCLMSSDPSCHFRIYVYCALSGGWPP